MLKSSRNGEIQYAALPFRIEPAGLRVCLLTSRETRRWVIPKGWPIRGLKPRDVAVQEAFEEGGLVGQIVSKHAIGSYHYTKGLPEGETRLCRVKVYLLSVDHQEEVWPEMDQRTWCWVDLTRAAQMVEEGGLAEIIRAAFPAVARLAPKGSKRSRRLPV